MNLVKTSLKKLVIYGDIIELYNFSHPYTYNYAPLPSSDSIRRIQVKKSDFALNRTRRSIYRLIEANTGKRNSFLTLTFAENVKDLKIANRLFSKFNMRFKYAYPSYDLKYLAVPEFQKRGAIHYHVVLFNSPYIKKEKLNSLWSYGYIDIKESRKIKSLSSYVAKYLSKFSFDKRLYGQKAYFASRNLVRPKVFRDEINIDNILENVKVINVMHEGQYNRSGRGHVTIKKFKFKTKNG